MRIPLLWLLAMSFYCAAASPGDYHAEMVLIPRGSFRMGSEIGNRDERPMKTVTVDSFHMGRHEVTLAWYLRCMADGVCKAPSWWSIGYFEDVPPHLTSQAEMSLPITGVSWQQAQAFCQWLGAGFTLPTEAEWEYAAGSGQSWIYPWGQNPKERFATSPKPKYLEPVAAHSPNALGLFDMGGHVWEWVLDCYEEENKSRTCLRRMSKGGSWSDHVWNLRVANKSFGFETQGYKGLGFRVVYHAP